MAPVSEEDVPEFARILAGNINRAAADYADRLRTSPSTGKKHVRTEEPKVLADFEDSVIRALGGYQPAQPRSRGVGKLVFQSFYLRADIPGEGRRTALIAALMAAQVEARGPLRLSTSQSERLAQILEQVGRGLEQEGLLRLAKVAYDRAARLHFQIEDFSARDTCLYRSASARRRAMPWRPRRLIQELSAALFGYGFRPARFLGWMGVQLVAACAVLLLVHKSRAADGTTQSRGETLYIALQNYINPMGVGDTGHMSHWAWVILTIESYFGSFSIAVFFTLLLRKWFRA